MPRILLIVVSLVFAHQLYGQTWRDSVGGSFGLLLCNDGSTIGQVMPCYQRGYGYSDLCPGAFLSRSLDGGVLWEQEIPQTGVFSDAGIVRMPGGVLRTMHSQYRNVFQESRDNGHTWNPTADTTVLEKVNNPFHSGYSLQRDRSGTLYWYYYGNLVYSIDNGQSFVMFDTVLTSSREVFIVGPRRILAMAYLNEGGTQDDSIMTSIDYGRTWQVVVGTNHTPGVNVQITVSAEFHDTLFMRAAYRSVVDGVIVGSQRYYYFNRDSNTFLTSDRDFGKCIYRGGTLDSTGGVWSEGSGYKYYKIGNPDDPCTYIWTRVSEEDIGKDPSYIFSYRRTAVANDVFYDLDGNIHPWNYDTLVYTGAPRPISVMDRLYTCTGMEIQLGGRQITRVELDLASSRNAMLQTSISANGRAALATITKRDTSQPMYIKLLAYDAELGQQVVYDSVANTAALPVVRTINVKGKVPDLEAEWKYGPFMWYRNGLPYRRDENNSVKGMSGSSIISNLEPGTYHVIGRTDWGCLVQSNTVVVNSTSIDEYSLQSGAYNITVQDREIQVHWSESARKPQRIQVYTLLGTELLADVYIENSMAVITSNISHQPLIIVLTTEHGISSNIVLK